MEMLILWVLYQVRTVQYNQHRLIIYQILFQQLLCQVQSFQKIVHYWEILHFQQDYLWVEIYRQTKT